MTSYVDKSISLLERKKRQWALEKDELEHLWAPWGNREPQSNLQPGRDQNTVNIAIVNHSQYRRDSSSQNSHRKNSLPPLSKNQYSSNEKYEKGGETSGYASDNPNNNPDYPQPPPWSNQTQNQSGYESSSSRDDRPKWRDKDWERKNSSHENKASSEPPNWLKRGLEQDGHIEVTNSSPSESPEQGYNEQDRPFTSTSSVRSRTYIRGQNIHLDTAELAERERKREIARIHQEAVRKQLEERERKRSEERKRRIQEEYEEELRIAKEQEIERRRQEHEQKLLQEKQEKEEKRKEAIKEAIEIAEREAKLQKMKLKLRKQQNSDNNENIKDNVNEKIVKNKNNDMIIKNNREKSNITPRDINSNIKINNNDKDEEKENLNNAELTKPDNRNTKICIKNDLELPSCSKNSNENHNISKNLQSQKGEPLAIVVPPNFETLQHFQYAVLMPVASSSSIPVAIPLSIATDKSQFSAPTTTRTENRILTPTQYRQKNKFMCDSSTQTDDYRVEKYSREKNSNLEASYERGSRKGRSSSRNENVSDRPKWGANRPPTRYLKQSEKDPQYQRKKLRQRNQGSIYDDKNSSDESQFGTPRFRKKGHLDKRHTRPLWRKHDRDEVFTRNIRMYQSEIIPIETDKDNVFFEHKCCCSCKCPEKYQNKIDILKIEHESSRKEEDRLPTRLNENLPGDQQRMAETLPSLRNDILKQEQWNSPRTPSLTSNGNNF